MLLDAEMARAEDTGDGALRFTFNAASAGDMKTLGAAFARAVLPQVKEEKRDRFRIGLNGNPGTGKTTFSQGMLGIFPQKISLESVASTRMQNVWRDPAIGRIRHYDCYYMIKNLALPSYLDNCTAHEEGLPLIDMAEHPHNDMHDKFFDCLVFLEKKKPVIEGSIKGERTVTICVAPELAATRRFGDFLKECAPMAKERSIPKEKKVPVRDFL